MAGFTVYIIISIIVIVSSSNYAPNSDATKLGPSPAAPSWPGTRKTRAERTRAETHVGDHSLRTRIFACPIPTPPSWVPRLRPRRGPKHVKTRAERTRAESHVGDPPSPHTYFYVSNSASSCSTPLRWRASGPQTKREPWAGALTGKKTPRWPKMAHEAIKRPPRRLERPPHTYFCA